MKYFGVSAKTGENVDILFDDIVNSLIKKYPINKINKNSNMGYSRTRSFSSNYTYIL